MQRGTLTEERKISSSSVSDPGYECCFCGKGIEPRPPDVCVLLLRTTFQENRTEPTQELFCHATCLKQRLRPGIPTII